MAASLVILTGASGSGKTTLARAVEAARLTQCTVVYFDSIGVPSAEEMVAIGGEAWQRSTTIYWLERVATTLRAGISVLFEGQMRIAFVKEALALAHIEGAHIILVDCDDTTRMRRLCGDRNQPELATAEMMNWGRYLHREAVQSGSEIIDTSSQSIAACRDRLIARLTNR